MNYRLSDLSGKKLLSNRATGALALVAIVLAVLAITIGIGALGEINEARYQRELQRYSRKLKPGMTREAVDVQLSTLGGNIRRFGNVYRIELGEEGWSLACAPAQVYIALQFGRLNQATPFGTDVLRGIEIARDPGACM